MDTRVISLNANEARATKTGYAYPKQPRTATGSTVTRSSGAAKSMKVKVNPVKRKSGKSAGVKKS